MPVTSNLSITSSAEFFFLRSDDGSRRDLLPASGRSLPSLSLWLLSPLSLSLRLRSRASFSWASITEESEFRRGRGRGAPRDLSPPLGGRGPRPLGGGGRRAPGGGGRDPSTGKELIEIRGASSKTDRDLWWWEPCGGGRGGGGRFMLAGGAGLLSAMVRFSCQVHH